MFLSSQRRRLLQLAAVAAAATLVGLPAHAERDSFRHGKIFISTNAPAGNEVLVYERSDGGAARPLTRAATHGIGTGGGLGSQGAVTLSRNGRWLFVVNAGSNTVSTFALGAAGLQLTSVTPSGGVTPTSVTEAGGLVYVLNAGGAGSVTGFRNIDGVLTPIAGATAALSAAGGTAPGQVGLSREGDVLVVTERATGLVTSWPVQAGGTLGTRTSQPSPGATPFGFAFTRQDRLVISEAAGGAVNASSASSYRLYDSAPFVPQVVSRAVPTGQTAACWVAVTPDGRFAFTSNAGSSSISTFAVARSGVLSLVRGVAAVTGVNTGALDAAVTPDGEQLHVFASRGLQIVSYRIGDDGALEPLGGVGGMPVGSAGLAAN